MRRQNRKKPFIVDSSPKGRFRAILPYLRESKIQKPTALDARRYMSLKEEGVSLEEMAAREGVKLQAIQKSIQKMQEYQSQYSKSVMELGARQIVIENMPAYHEALKEALVAMEERYNEDGELVSSSPAHKIRSEAMKEIRELMQYFKDAAPLVNVDASTTNNTLNHAQFGAGINFESIVRQIREEKGYALPEKTETSEYVVPEEIDRELQEELDVLAEEDDDEKDYVYVPQEDDKDDEDDEDDEGGGEEDDDN